MHDDDDDDDRPAAIESGLRLDISPFDLPDTELEIVEGDDARDGLDSDAGDVD
jgi:hypothetical protein